MEYNFVNEGMWQYPTCHAFGRKYYIVNNSEFEKKCDFRLMSCSERKMEVMYFADENELASYLYDKKVTDIDHALYLINELCEFKCESGAIIRFNGKSYAWRKAKKELRERKEQITESELFSTYEECLDFAQEFLQKKEKEHENDEN